MAHYKGAASEGTRAVNLLKKRERAREELERMKQKISEVTKKRNYKIIIKNHVTSIHNRIIC